MQKILCVILYVGVIMPLNLRQFSAEKPPSGKSPAENRTTPVLSKTDEKYENGNSELETSISEIRAIQNGKPEKTGNNRDKTPEPMEIATSPQKSPTQR